MIRVIHYSDGSSDLHVDAKTAGYLASLLTQARPGGTAAAPTPSGVLRVHVHAKAVEAPPPHVPIEAK